jgi:tRNA dimethylallyltransferase
VGGTGLYFKALTDGLVKIPKIPITTRNKIRLLQNQLNQKKFYSKLLAKDPLVQNKIDPTDVQRSVRAYEVITVTKKSIFDWYKNTKSSFKEDQFVKIYIDYPKDKLLNKISKRVDRMMKDGAVKEVKKFLKLNLKNDNNIFKVIGIREIKDFIDKKTSLQDLKLNIVIKTRQYAKRQRTWSRGQMVDWQKLDSNALSRFIKKL